MGGINDRKAVQINRRFSPVELLPVDFYRTKAQLSARAASYAIPYARLIPGLEGRLGSFQLHSRSEIFTSPGGHYFPASL